MVSLSEENVFQVFGSKMLGRIFGLQKAVVSDWGIT
jgi:hypothetical protein